MLPQADVQEQVVAAVGGGGEAGVAPHDRQVRDGGGGERRGQGVVDELAQRGGQRRRHDLTGGLADRGRKRRAIDERAVDAEARARAPRAIAQPQDRGPAVVARHQPAHAAMAIEGRAVDHRALDTVAELHDHAGRHRDALVGRGHEVDRDRR